MDQIIAGVVLNIVAPASRRSTTRPAKPPGLMPSFDVPILSRIPMIGDVFFTGTNIFATLAILAAIGVHLGLFHTRWGLRTRAVGEYPSAADTAGISVERLRLVNVTMAGALAGCAGVYLSMDASSSFERNMVAGRGFLALAIMIMGALAPAARLRHGDLLRLHQRRGQPAAGRRQLRRAAAAHRHPAVRRDDHRARGRRGPGPGAGAVGSPTSRETSDARAGVPPTPVPADTAPEHLEAIATTDAVLELPPEKSGFGEGNVGEVLLDIVGLTKSFGSVRANRDISLNVRRGEIVALLGENGAGKSTLVNQIFGLITPDAGTVSVKGDTTPIKDPRDAIRRGIGMVHQHFQLVPVMTVAENMMLGHEPTRGGGVLDLDSAREMVRTLSEKHGLRVDPDAEVEDLPVGTQQRVEILKALSRKVGPAHPRRADRGAHAAGDRRAARRHAELAASGTANRLHHPQAARGARRLRPGLRAARGRGRRRGRDQGHRRPRARHDDGRPRGRPVDRQGRRPPAESVLTIDDLHVKDDRDLGAVNGFSLEVRAGEIVGVAGVEGNGQRELVEALAGMRKVVAGTMTLGDLDLTKANPNADAPRRRRPHPRGPREARPRRRRTPSPTTSSSTSSTRRRTPRGRAPVRRGPIQRRGALRDEFDIRSSSVGQARARSPAATSRRSSSPARCRSSPLLMAAQPTRGVDVGSIEFIHRRIVDARDAGAAVLLVSAELDEILSLSDRIAVVHGGKVVAEMPGRGADRTEIGRLMAGDH